MATIIVAYDENRVIGLKNSIPWNVPEDRKLFSKITTGNVVIMGRNTWESLPDKYRPLPNRVNMVITTTWTDEDVSKNSVPAFKTLEAALEAAKSMNKSIYIIGGAKLYDYALKNNLVRNIIVSKIYGTHEGDTTFPVLSKEWKIVGFNKYEKFERQDWTNGVPFQRMDCSA